MKYRRGRNKYNNRKGGGFDSQKEMDRYHELLLMERAGIIHGLKRQVPFQLTPTVRKPDVIGPRGGRKPGKVILNKSEYIADFTYYQGEDFIVEDVKGYRDGAAYREFMLKKKMLYHLRGILIHET